MRTIFLILIIFFIWVSKRFFNNSAKNLPRTTILIILTSSVFLSLLIQKVININNVTDFNLKKFKNPLYEEFLDIGDNYDLDLSFTKTAWIQRGPNNYKVNSLFQEKEKSIDILFFGDSTIAWGLIPNVLEQITGKKVAVYAYESNVLTKKTSKLFNKISKYYLKENGLIIFSFTGNFLMRNPNSALVSKKELNEMISWSSNDFKEFAQKNEKDMVKKYVSLDTYKILFEKYISFNTYRLFYEELSNDLKNKYYFFLKSPLFYSKYIEPIINLELSVKKQIHENSKIKFIRWDMRTITEYNKGFKFKSRYSDKIPSVAMINKNVQINAEAASQIYGQNKIYMVPLFMHHKFYLKSRNIYLSYYKNLGFKLCDLGTFQSKKDKYTMQGARHMGNEGGLMQSILIGKWLEKYFKVNLQNE